jgi:hypothetical protein
MTEWWSVRLTQLFVAAAGDAGQYSLLRQGMFHTAMPPGESQQGRVFGSGGWVQQLADGQLDIALDDSLPAGAPYTPRTSQQ